MSRSIDFHKDTDSSPQLMARLNKLIKRPKSQLMSSCGHGMSSSLYRFYNCLAIFIVLSDFSARIPECSMLQRTL